MTGSTLTQVMAYCLTPTIHYLQINVDLTSVGSSDNHLGAISQDILHPLIKITYLKFPSNLPGANELTVWHHRTQGHLRDWQVNLKGHSTLPCPWIWITDLTVLKSQQSSKVYPIEYVYGRDSLTTCPWSFSAFKFRKEHKIFHFFLFYIEGHIKLQQYMEKGT